VIDQPRLHVTLQHGGQHEQSPDAEDDARHRGQQFDRDADGRFNTAGQSSVRKSAIPNPTGTASAMAMAEVTMVP